MRITALIAAAGLVTPAVCNNGGGKKLVSSKALEKLVKLDDLIAGAQTLQDIADANGGNRAFGGAGHNATVDWLYKTLKATGYYNVVKQPFVELFSAATVSLTAGEQDFTAAYMTYAPGGVATAPLVEVANIGCDAADYPAELSGNIALISRGTCPFGQKAASAKAAGAVGTIIYNNIEGNLAGTLGGVGDYAPTVGVTLEVGTQLKEIAAAGTEVTLDVLSIQENRTNYNVIAETKGGDHNNVLVLGGHSDSVFAGPGINDDGSGTVGVWAVAKYLTKFKVKNAVRFAFWGAEEFGKLGSFHYLRTLNGTISGGPEEVAKVRAYLNFDMIASPNYVLGIYDGDGGAFNFSGPAGSDTIEKDFEAFYENKGLPHVPSLFSMRSDYAAFLENGIPSGGLFTGAEELKTEEEAQLFGGEAGVALDANYHQAGDTIDNLAHDAFLLNTQSIANSVGKYAVAFDGIPRPNATLRKRDAEKSRLFARFDDGHAHSHAAPCSSVKNTLLA
ncbi:leupeptin-inactivating enzyme 1 precursor [Corynespora cassiicola Philippines]|uniref:Peptide hydrolase n=1 Tax=Corynespora cassiicola Philippines TaxID=1448308 RepID=A0A2T2N8M1_CORCC|nr:leupeptin-inactivating enzyme 1 precursor [Corynespora cassiicola Philippines]